MKKKMTNKKFNAIIIPIISVTSLLAIASTIACNYFEASLDNYLGRGKIIYEDGSVIYNKEDTNYYSPKYEKSMDGKIKASHDGYKLTEEIASEGEILLKNDGTLPLKRNTKVTPFGYRYINPIMTGKGSGAVTLLQDFVINAKKGLNNYFDVNKKVEGILENSDAKFATSNGYKSKADENGTFSGATASVGEYPSSIYKTSDIGDYKTGIVFIGRQGGEGDDLQITEYRDGNKIIAEHQLQLMPYEKEMISFAKNNCDKVIIIVNSPNPIELKELNEDADINSILWVGSTGSRGFESMGKILCGEVNPSGRTPDIYTSNFKNDPTYNNFGTEYFYNNSKEYNFTEYEEGIYVGYKYYETKYGNDQKEYNKAVTYPFGYGLHYEDDLVSQELTDVIDNEDKITVKGIIKNESSYDVKEVVQIYYEAPYYSSLNESKIEKARKNLVEFDKKEVKKGTTEKFEVSFSKENMASYDYKGFYSNGNGSYVLEKGDYTIYLGKNSHDSWAKKTIKIDQTIAYYENGNNSEVNYAGKRKSDKVIATNLFENVSNYMDGVGEYGASGSCENLTRENNLSTKLNAPLNKNAPEAVLNEIIASENGTNSNDDKIIAKYGNQYPISNAENDLILSDLRGKEYNDLLWDKLLDQLKYTGDDLNEINKLLGTGSFNTGKLTSIGKGTTSESDGPQAIGKTGVSDGTGASNAYTAEVVLAATFNKNLAKQMGVCIGEEALTQGSNGWYAPACNIHRSPFMGRLYEYYSEDSYLSGCMARYVIEGASSKGYLPYMKHFAINEQDLGRHGLSTWVNEQAMRELYFKPFEMAVKGAIIEENYLEKKVSYDDSGKEAITYEKATRTMKGCLGVMTSLNRIGGTYTCANYDLTTSLLRNEWGFEGVVISDSYTPINNQMNVGISAGNDFYLSFMSSKLKDTTSVSAQWSIRQAIKNICYGVVNSNAMQNVGPGMKYHYSMSPWKWIIISIDTIAGFVLVGGITWIIIRSKKNNI